jgi:hypothetical protein
MIYHARRKAWKVLDATADITIIHQNHDYSHLPDGKIHYRLPESEENVALGGGVHHMDNLIDLDGIMIDGQAQPKPLTWFRLVRKTERLLQPKGQAGKVRTRLYTIVKRYRKRL